MKTSFNSIITALLLITSLSSFATVKKPEIKSIETERILASYLETIALGNFDYQKTLFAEDFEYRNSADNKAYNKKQFVQFLKDTKGLKYNCTTTYEILDECGQACLGKIIMQFKDFTRIDYITLSYSNKGWQVSKVVTSYI